MNLNYNVSRIILLPYDHRFSRLYAEFIHNECHYGVAATASKIRSRFWISNLEKMAKSIRYSCVQCRKLDKKLCSQIMGKLPIDRLKPAPAWSSTSLDLFGPFLVKGEVNKRVRMKVYGVLFTCMLTRAVHIDLARDYSTDAFMQVLRRFISLRGCPTKIRSDPGSQLVGAKNDILDHNQMIAYGAKVGFAWEMSPADSPWQNGCAEALIKSTKKAIISVVGEQIMTYSEFQTVLFEIANLECERPIGKQSNDINDGSYLCPNDMLLGRASSRVPSEQFSESCTFKKRHEFIQSMVNAFWVKWNRFYFPTLLIQQKWHTERRNLQVGDIVIIQDNNALRGNWKLGRVSKVFAGSDGKVRRVDVSYKNATSKEKLNEYTGRGFTTVERSVQRLVVILPVEEQT